MRNPSKNTIKRIMRRAYASANGEILAYCGANWRPGKCRHRANGYFLFNWVGAHIYTMSKGKICNREPKGGERYLIKNKKCPSQPA